MITHESKSEKKKNSHLNKKRKKGISESLNLFQRKIFQKWRKEH